MASATRRSTAQARGERFMPPVKTVRPIVRETSPHTHRLTRETSRSPTSLMPIFYRHGVHGVASGSAYGEAGSSKLLLCIYGPRPSERTPQFNDTASLKVEVKLARFSTPSAY